MRNRRLDPLSRLVLLLALVGACSTNKRVPLSASLDPFPRSALINHDYKLFEVKSGVLLALVPEERTNLVSVDVRYRVGAAEDPPGKEGLAHFVEHLMFQVKSSTSDATLGAILNDKTLFNNAYTNFDETHYTSTALRESLGAILNIEAERMSASCEAITDSRIERERQIVKRELKERAGVGTELRSSLTNAVFPSGHAYRRRISGSSATVDAITRDDICQFIDAHYGPDRAILVVSGKFDTTAVRAFVSHAFGQIPKRSKGARASVAPLSLGGGASSHRAKIESPLLVVAFSDPPWGTAPAMRRGFFLSLLEARLAKLIDGDLGVKSVSTGRLGGWRGGVQVAMFVLEPDADPKKVEDAFFKGAAALVQELARYDIGKYQGHYRTGLIARHEPYAGRAVNVADYLQYTTHNRFLLRDLETIDGITPDGLRIEAEALSRSQTHVALVTPDGDKSARKAARLSEVGKSFDLESWRLPADASRAEKPIVIKAARPKRRVTHHELANGLKIILAPDFSYPTVDIRLVFPAGSADELPDKRGAAELAGLLLEDDTSQLTAETTRLTALANIRAYENIVLIGARESARVTEDYTTFAVRGMSIYADALLWQLYFRVHSGAYDKKRFRELQKLAKELDKSDTSSSTEPVRAALFGDDHPYASRMPARALLELSRADLQRFRERHYRAPGATLIVAGRFDPTKLLPRIERLWSPWSGKTRRRTDRSVPPARPSAGPTAFVASEPDRAQPHLLIGFALDRDASTLAERLVLRAMLTERLSSIRERLGASYGISVGLGRARGPVLLTIAGEVEAARASQAFTEIQSAITAIRDGGTTTAADFVRARRRALEQLLADSASANSTATELEYVAAHGERDDYFARLADEVASLTHSKLSKVFSTQLTLAREAIVLRGPKNVTRAMLEAVGIRQARELQ